MKQEIVISRSTNNIVIDAIKHYPIGTKITIEVPEHGSRTYEKTYQDLVEVTTTN